VEPDDGATYTVARRDTQIRLLEVDATRSVGRAHLHLGAAEVHTTVVGYQRKDALTAELLHSEALDLPTSTLVTRAFWYVIGSGVVEEASVDRARLPGALHAIEHAAIGMLPLFAICDRWDVGGVSTARQVDTNEPTIVIYDAMPGGAGVAELGFEAADRHLRATLEAVRACGCDDGCPSCVQSPKCGNANEHLDKAAALKLLDALLP
jgi:DEAD/DEAH box helicase domain-containing protein